MYHIIGPNIVKTRTGSYSLSAGELAARALSRGAWIAHIEQLSYLEWAQRWEASGVSLGNLQAAYDSWLALSGKRGQLVTGM